MEHGFAVAQDFTGMAAPVLSVVLAIMAVVAKHALHAQLALMPHLQAQVSAPAAVVALIH